MAGITSNAAGAQTIVSPAEAGTVITNIATLNVGRDTAQTVISSNPAHLTVAERLDVALQAASPTAAIPVGIAALPFLLTNRGNGSEAFALAGQLSGIDATIQGFAIDRNGDGAFDPAVDLAIAQAGVTPTLAAGQSLALLVLLHSNVVSTAGTLTLRAAAVTGSGAPGMLFAGRGDGGADAIAGPTGAAATLGIALAVVDGSGGSGGDQAITLVKSQAVAGPNGASTPTPGATITYTIVATFAGSGRSPAARLIDPIPAGTTYVAGSLNLDGTVLSDAADADAGRVDTAGIAVALGDVAAPATHTVTFKVTIQ
ncbi:hypothetical protein U1872_00090 [Sphingomonas sp. RB3P16]|uniref:hypothetical protein n=1 Tax=Parasphingomonas frigoris TaxID=3096163 RepID=UPI002FC6C94E